MSELLPYAGCKGDNNNNNNPSDAVVGVKKFKVLTTIEKTIETTVEIGSNYVATSKTCHVLRQPSSNPKSVSIHMFQTEMNLERVKLAHFPCDSVTERSSLRMLTTLAKYIFYLKGLGI